jgi:carbamoyl-phosphate synthase large subunit
MGAIRGLQTRAPGDEDIFILGLDASADGPASQMVDAYKRMPLVAEGIGYVEALADVLCSHTIDVLLPGIDAEIALLSRERARLARSGAEVVLAPAELVEAADDKLSTASYLTERGIGAPETLAPASSVSFAFPLVAKPRRGNASRGVEILADQTALARFLAQGRREYCLQRWIDGPEITVGFLYDRAGICRDAIAMQRVLENGRTTRGTVIRTPEIERFMSDFGTRIRGVGAVNAQLRIDPNRGPLVFEVNARLSGSTEMRIAIGFNDPLRLVKHFARDEPIEASAVPTVTVYRYLSELIVIP